MPATTPATLAPPIENAPVPPTDTTPPAPVPQNITINMVTPQSGEPTEGLSEIEPMGRFIIMEPDLSKPGKFIKKTVNAEGKPLD